MRFCISHSDSLILRIFVYKEASRKYSASACMRYNLTLNSTDRTIIRKAWMNITPCVECSVIGGQGIKSVSKLSGSGFRFYSRSSKAHLRIAHKNKRNVMFISQSHSNNINKCTAVVICSDFMQSLHHQKYTSIVELLCALSDDG